MEQPGTAIRFMTLKVLTHGAIAACVKAGGGTVFVPPGTFVIGTVRLYSNMNLQLSPGAVLCWQIRNTETIIFYRPILDLCGSVQAQAKRLG